MKENRQYWDSPDRNRGCLTILCNQPPWVTRFGNECIGMGNTESKTGNERGRCSKGCFAKLYQ